MSVTIGSVLFLTPIGRIGGAERALVDLVASLRTSGSKVRTEVITGGDGPLVDELRGAGASVDLLPMPEVLLRSGEATLAATSPLAALSGAAGTFSWARRLRAIVRERRVDVVHTNGMKLHVLGALAAGGDAPVVWHLRDLVGARVWSPRLLRLAARRVRGAIAVSRLVACDLERRMPIQVQVVHDAVDTLRFDAVKGPAGDGLDRLAGLPAPPGGTVRVGLVATYARWKGHHTFLKAAARVDPALPVRFYVVGGPIYSTGGSQLSTRELRAWAAELGLDQRLALVDFQSDVAAAYAGLDIVVHASTTPEPFGLTIAEAMASGRAVVAVRTAGCAERLEAGRDLELVSPDDPVALAEAIEALARDPERRRELGARARVTARRAFNRERLAIEVLEAYRCLGIERGGLG